MAAPSYTEDLTDISTMESTTGVSAYGGGASGLAVNPDSSMQGTNGVGKQITAADKGMYYDNGSGITLGAGDHVFVWLFCTTPGLTDTIQNKGTSILVGTGGTAYCQYHVNGNDTYGAAGRVGLCYPVDYSVRTTNASAPYRTATGTPGANPQIFGGGLVTTASVKGENLVVDAIRYGTGAYLTAGELISAGDGSDNPCTFSGFQAQNDAVANRWGILTLVGGAYELQGKFVIGQNNSKTATLARFKDSNKTITFANTIHAASTFNEIIIDHASTRCEWDNINLTALGSTSPGALTVNSNNPTFVVNGGTYQGMGATTLRSNTTIDGVTWLNSGQITSNTATTTNCTITGYSGATDTSALVWNTATDPDGYLDGTTFVKGSGTTHAIELGTTSPTTINLTDITFSGYTNTVGSTSAPLHIKRTTGTVTINLNNCTGITTSGYKTDGATVNIIAGSVTFTVTAQTDTGTAISGATVHVRATATTGTLPVGASVTISNSGTTATVTHTSHGLSTNDKVYIAGASLNANNGTFQITVTGANTYTYTMGSSPGSSPTGTITSTFVFLDGTTNGSGQISMSRVFGASQSFTGWTRKSTSSPLYRQGVVNGTVSSTTGGTATATMISDE